MATIVKTVRGFISKFLNGKKAIYRNFTTIDRKIYQDNTLIAKCGNYRGYGNHGEIDTYLIFGVSELEDTLAVLHFETCLYKKSVFSLVGLDDWDVKVLFNQYNNLNLPKSKSEKLPCTWLDVPEKFNKKIIVKFTKAIDIVL